MKTYQQLKRKPFSLCFLGMLFVILPACTHQQVKTEQQINVSFGSCLRQWQAQPIWQGITALKPEAFIFLGDNMYSDVGNYRLQQEPQRIRQAYQDLAATVEYQQFLKSAEVNGTTLFATWDDHDYGKNDAGADYAFKVSSKDYFRQFFGIEKTVTGSGQAGIYHSKIVNLKDVQVQFLMLDTRSFRSQLKQNPLTTQCSKVNNGENIEPDSTILGERQWQWLAAQLELPADVRILASSIQLIPTEHCYEKWANFPNERNRLLKLIKNSQANGLIILSGDRHLAEISVLPPSVLGYPLYEITSSGLNSAMGKQSQGKTETNQFRITDNNVLINNFGNIQIIQGNNKDIKLKLQIRDEKGLVLQQQEVLLNSLRH